MNLKALLKRIYDYLDTYGVVYKESDPLFTRQQAILNDLRNAINSPEFVPRQNDALPARLTIIQNGTSDSYRVSLVSEHDNEMCALCGSCTFEGAHFELSNWTTWFRERGCRVEVVDSSKMLT